MQDLKAALLLLLTVPIRNIYPELRYLLDSRWSDRRETLHVNSVRHEHENSQGPMSIALC